MTGKKGFSLIELMFVMAIIAILAAISVPSYMSSLVKSREAVLKENLFQVRTAIDKYYGDKGEYPATIHTLVDDKYIRSMPYDPIADSSDLWEEVYNDNGSGITDLRSSSTNVGTNGKPYNEW